MKTVSLQRAKAGLARQLAAWRARGLTVGFVPTMGALHSGHAALVSRAAAENDRVVVSIFVNPLQFGPNEDYGRYPRALPADRRLVAAAGADIVYAPSVKEMYGDGTRTTVEVAEISELYCGKYRPGHFRGVATVVLKLFNQVRPDRAYFGEKDFQQVVVLERMVADLNVPVKIVRVPTVRQADGLALSSRNEYLTPSERLTAPVLNAALLAGRREARRGGASVKSVTNAVRRALAGSLLRIQYVAVGDEKTLAPAKNLRGRRRLLAAVYLGRTRLIDNTSL